MRSNLLATAALLSAFTTNALGQTDRLGAPGANEYGGAEAYADPKTGESITPTVEIKDGKAYYTWPHWHQWKNFKMQVPDTRTEHPDAQWWPHAGLGIFMHWGIVSEFEATGEAWAGRWSQANEDKGNFHPQQAIWDAAETFNPTKYDAQKWMAAAKKAGFEYAVLTTKHHDGYALWDSDHALIGVRQYLDGQDLVASFVNACRGNDIKVGFYYSGMDWYFERDYMNFSVQSDVLMDYKGQKVKTLPKRPPSFSTAYNEYNEAQVKELIHKFDPDIWWGDGGHGMTADAIRKLRPGVVLNNRGEGGDHATAEGFAMAHPTYIKKPVTDNGWWWEVNTIITRGSWHYDNRPDKGEFIYPSDEILMQAAKARCMGGNYLANIGPRPDGQFQEQAYRLFSDMAEWMATNRDSIHGINGGGPWPEKCNAPITCRDHVWYFHADKTMATADAPIVLKDAAKPVSVKLMRTGSPLKYTYENNTLSVVIPNNLKAGKVTDVVVVDFGEDFDTKPYLFKHW